MSRQTLDEKLLKLEDLIELVKDRKVLLEPSKVVCTKENGRKTSFAGCFLMTPDSNTIIEVNFYGDVFIMLRVSPKGKETTSSKYTDLQEARKALMAFF